MIRQFDVCSHPDRSSRSAFPYLVVLQHDSVRTASDIIVAPLAPVPTTSASWLEPALEMDGQQLLMLTQLLGPVPRRLLNQPVATLEDSRSRIIAAIDILFAGS